MPVSARFLPQHFLVYLRYEGQVTSAQNAASLAAGLADPDYRKGMNQLVDLAAVTGWDRDFIALMKHQAREAEIHDDPNRPTLIVVYAPSETARQLANIVNRSWARSARVVTVTVETEPEALAVLGIAASTFATLLQHG